MIKLDTVDLNLKFNKELEENFNKIFNEEIKNGTLNENFDTVKYQKFLKDVFDNSLDYWIKENKYKNLNSKLIIKDDKDNKDNCTKI